jgi:hypothetical protein
MKNQPISYYLILFQNVLELFEFWNFFWNSVRTVESYIYIYYLYLLISNIPKFQNIIENKKV